MLWPPLREHFATYQARVHGECRRLFNDTMNLREAVPLGFQGFNHTTMLMFNREMWTTQQGDFREIWPVVKDFTHRREINMGKKREIFFQPEAFLSFGCFTCVPHGHRIALAADVDDLAILTQPLAVLRIS